MRGFLCFLISSLLIVSHLSSKRWACISIRHRERVLLTLLLSVIVNTKNLKHTLCSFPCGVYNYLYVCVLSHFSCVRLCVTPWTVARQAPLSMGLSRREYWSELLSSRGVFLSQGSNTSLLCLLHWQAGSLPLATLGKPQIICIPILKSKSLAGYLKNEPAFNQTSLVFILKPPWSSSWNIEKPNLQEELEQRQ